jgi:protease IV
MFSRRHPYLFFLLMMSVTTVVGIVLFSLVVVVGLRSLGYRDFTAVRGEKVGVVEITGPIFDSKETIREIKEFREDKDVKAIVIRINSPGGAVGPSQEIYREIRKTLPLKKVITSMGSVAASGAYYIASATDGIMANPGTITGSIGVIIEYTNFESLFQKIGLAPVVIKSGKFKDIGSPVRKMTQKEKQLLQDFVNKTRGQFVRDVAEGRGCPVAKIDALADGRIYSGEEAKANGLVDRMGNLEDAIEWAGRMGGIKGKIVPVYAQPERQALLDYLTGSFAHQLARWLAASSIHAAYLFKPGASEP